VATQALNARLEHCCFRCKKVRYNQSDDVVHKKYSINQPSPDVLH
jgi:hypothetical protein